MKKRFWLFCCVLTVALFASIEGQAQIRSESGSPIILNSYAPSKGRFGDTLKIYLEADDPEANMAGVYVVVNQPGYGTYPVNTVYLKREYRSHLKGYLHWNTFSSKTLGLPEWTNISISVSVFDGSGKESNPVVFPFVFVSESIPDLQPPEPFGQGNLPRLGYVNVELKGPTDPMEFF